MARKLAIGILPLGVALLAVSSWTARPAVPAAGPPWMSVEVPANPLDPTTRDAVMLVHVYHHEHPAGYAVRGTAEGIVDGSRRSVPLEFTRTSRPGVYALALQWDEAGDWVLTIGIEQQDRASMLVELGPNGGVIPISYYNRPAKTLALRSVQVVSGRISDDRVEETLTRLSRRAGTR